MPGTGVKDIFTKNYFAILAERKRYFPSAQVTWDLQSFGSWFLHLTSPQLEVPSAESGEFLSNTQSDTREDFRPPWGNFLESQSEKDFCLVSLSNCNDQVQRGHRKPTGHVLSCQRRDRGAGPAPWERVGSSPRFLPPGRPCFGF